MEREIEEFDRREDEVAKEIEREEKVAKARENGRKRTLYQDAKVELEFIQKLASLATG